MSFKASNVFPPRSAAAGLGTRLPRDEARVIESPFSALDVYWRSLESGDVWCKSRQLKMKICSP